MSSSDIAYQINCLLAKEWIELDTQSKNRMTGYKKTDIIHESDKAYLIRRGKRKDWFPKSQVEIVTGRIFISPWIRDQIEAKKMQKRQNKKHQHGSRSIAGSQENG